MGEPVWLSGPDLERLVADAYRAGYRRAVEDFARGAPPRSPGRWRRVLRRTGMVLGIVRRAAGD